MDVLHYRDLSKEEKKVICNGCGGKGAKIKVPNFLFKASCNQHDFYYWRGCSEENRYTSDREFYNIMKEDIASKKYSVFRRGWYYSWAFVYYQTVRSFGNKYFEYGMQQKTRFDLDKIMLRH